MFLILCQNICSSKSALIIWSLEAQNFVKILILSFTLQFILISLLVLFTFNCTTHFVDISCSHLQFIGDWVPSHVSHDFSFTFSREEIPKASRSERYLQDCRSANEKGHKSYEAKRENQEPRKEIKVKIKRKTLNAIFCYLSIFLKIIVLWCFYCHQESQSLIIFQFLTCNS